MNLNRYALLIALSLSIAPLHADEVTPALKKSHDTATIAGAYKGFGFATIVMGLYEIFNAKSYQSLTFEPTLSAWLKDLNDLHTKAYVTKNYAINDCLFGGTIIVMGFVFRRWGNHLLEQAKVEAKQEKKEENYNTAL